MAQKKSSAKRVRQNEKKSRRNKAVKTRAKNAKQKFFDALEDGDEEKAEEMFRHASKVLHRAASKGVLHENKVARDQSRLQRRLNQLKSNTG